MVISIGVDVVDIPRLQRALERTPALHPRLFGRWDLDVVGHGDALAASLAARFAAKEAVLKCLGGSVEGFHWHDIQVSRPAGNPPTLVVTGSAATRAAALGIDRWHLSMSHDGGIAIAFVIAESTQAGPDD